MSLIRSLADTLETTGSPEQIWRSAIDYLPAMDLSKVIYMDLSPNIAPVILSNADDTWAQTYRRTVEDGKDPFAKNCLTGFATQLTGIGHAEGHSHLQQVDLIRIAQGSAALGICTGMSVTIKSSARGAGVGMNLMSKVSAREFAELRHEREDTWRAWCQLVHAALDASRTANIPPLLTVKQRDCLACVADGSRTAEVAHKLGISEATVEMHLRNARVHLCAKTRDQAVAIAMCIGLI